MSADRRHRIGRGATLALLAVSGGMLVLTPVASAQGLLGAIFGAFGGSAPRPPAYSSYAPPSLEGRLAPMDIPDPAERSAGSGIVSGNTHCVRLCDGRYFPLPRAAASVAPAKICNAICPAAATKVFYGSDPTRAVASDGTRYDDLDNALAYRDKVVPDCSCTGRGPGGLAQIDIESDPTLRPGDVVVRADGPALFRGSNGYPYKSADFTPIDGNARMSGDLRARLSQLRVDKTALSAVPVQNLAEATDEPRAAKPRPRRVQANENSGYARPDPWRALFR